MSVRKLIAILFFVPVFAFAGVQVFNSSNASLGVHSKIKCGTGITCSASGGKLGMSAVLDPAVTGAEAGDATLTLAADESDDNGDDWTVVSAASGNALTFNNDTSGSAVAKLSLSTAGAMTSVTSITGAGTGTVSGYLTKQVAATATTITAAQCGSTFINAGAIEMELPEASTVLGCELTFIVGNASNFTIDPDAADQIVLSTNAAGDSLIADAVGEVLKIQAISASQWAPMIQTGTWTDSN